MLPGSTPERNDREAARGKLSGRTQEIQRLIGRSLRAVTDLEVMGEAQITVDCDVLQADGGTRTASICGGYVALHDACSRLVAEKKMAAHPITDTCGAISVGIVDALASSRPRLLRRRARRGRHERRDDRLRSLHRGAGHRRGHAVLAPELDDLLGLAEHGIAQIFDIQRGARRAACAAPAVTQQFVLATANPDKAREIAAVLADAGVAIELIPRPTEVPDVDETGETLEENARLKAVALCAATGLPAIADDTGLEVDALGGAPGVRSARFAGEDATYADNVASCSTGRDGVRPEPERTARFATVALARWPDGREVAAFGDGRRHDRDRATRRGRIRVRPGVRARGGRRPDVRRDDPAEKHELSHRGRAFRTLADGLRSSRRPDGSGLRDGERMERDRMAVIDIAGFVADLKDHAVEHGFHVHDERHFVESYSLRQNWEVDLHPEEGCEGPVDLYLSLEIDPRVLLGFEDAVIERADVEDPPDEYHFPLNFTWALPPLPHGPDLLVLATELAGHGGPDLPLEVSAIDSIPAATDAPERSLRIVAHQSVSLLHIRDGDAVSCEVLDRCLDVSRYLLDQAGDWLG